MTIYAVVYEDYEIFDITGVYSSDEEAQKTLKYFETRKQPICYNTYGYDVYKYLVEDKFTK